MYKGVFLIAACLMVMICSLCFSTFLVSAHADRGEAPGSFKYYKSIVIQPGDTLWEIAEEYKTSDCDSTEEYVEVLKEMNSLDTDTIHSGQNLMIAYNSTEFIE